MKNKRVAITGGAGFIGSNLAHELATDNTVIIIDDLSTGKVENIERQMKQLSIKNINPEIMLRFQTNSGARGMRQPQYLSALVELHTKCKELARNGGGEHFKQILEDLGLQEITV